jgi:hypothetical protein
VYMLFCCAVFDHTIRNANPGPNQAMYMRKGELLCIAYKDADNKKPVRMLSTFHSAQELPSTILFFPTGQINDTSIYLPDTPSSVGLHIPRR